MSFCSPIAKQEKIICYVIIVVVKIVKIISFACIVVLHARQIRQPSPTTTSAAPAVFQGMPQEIPVASPPDVNASPPTSFFKKKGVMAGLIIGLVLLCILLLAAVGFVLVQTGVISLPGGGGDRILIGMPNRDGEADLYFLGLGKDLEKATLVAEDARSTSLYISYLQDSEYQRIGNYTHYYGGFVPGQSYLLVWYRDEDGETHVLRQAYNQDTPVEIFKSDENFMWGDIVNNGNDLFINEPRSNDNRCYFSPAGAEAERVAKGDDCFLVNSGAYLFQSEYNDGETTLISMKPDGSDEVTLLDAQEDVSDFRTSYDGSRVAYLSTEDDQQIILINGRNGEEINRGETVYNILTYYFAAEAQTMIYIAENEDGELDLYTLDDGGSLLVATGLFLNADISRDGQYVIYMTGDEDGDETVFSYNISNGQSTEIVSSENLTFTLVDSLERILVAEQDGDELILSSANLNGGDVVVVFDDDNAYLEDIFYYPDRGGLFIQITDDDDNNSLFYTQKNNPDGFFVLEEYAVLNVLDLSPNSDLLLVNSQEDPGDDPALMVVALEPDAKPVILDDDEDDYTTGVFSDNGRQVIYTAQTGNNSDDYEVRQVQVNGEDAPETLYAEAYLVAVEWTSMQPFRYTYLDDTLESSSYCPGAPTITIGSTLDGSLNDTGEYCYRFTASASQVFTFSINAEYDFVLSLYDRDGYQLDRDDDSGPGMNARLTTSLPADGTYYIVVSSYGSATGSYTISMEEGVGDTSIDGAILLPNNTLTRGYITIDNAIYIASTDYATYGVMYYFEGNAGETVMIDVIAHSQGSYIDSYLYLYDSTMQLLSTDDDSGAEYDLQIIATLPTTGRYYILVEDLGSDYGTQTDYWFDVLLTR